jgi:hypothetical protein
MLQLVTFDELRTPQEQVQCVLWLAELQSLKAARRRFTMQYGRQPPTRKSIQFWDNNNLRTTGSLLRVRSGKTQTSEENVNRIREASQRSPRESFRASSLQLRTNSTFSRARCATQKSPPKSVQDSNDSCT